MTKTQFGAAAFVLTGALTAGVLAKVLPVGPRQPAATPKAPAAAASPDPWPECKLARAWFRENLNDPQDLEVIEWTRTTDADNVPQWPAGLTRVDAKVRAKNQYGGKQVETKCLFFRDGKLLGEMP